MSKVTYSHAECRRLAENYGPLVTKVVDQLIGEALQVQGEVDAWKQARETHLEAIFALWDGGFIEHTEECNAHPEEDTEDIDNRSCDCGAVAIVNGDHFKAARKLTSDRMEL